MLFFKIKNFFIDSLRVVCKMQNYVSIHSELIFFIFAKYKDFFSFTRNKMNCTDTICQFTTASENDFVDLRQIFNISIKVT